MSEGLTEYRQAIECARSNESQQAIYARMNILAASTEDPNLKKLLLEAMDMLRRGGRDRIAESGRNLTDYAEGVISHAKPQWQYLAELHGWRPPEAQASVLPSNRGE